ncbi:MAG: MaoC family dehydratase N-terminal domain-containing protein [Candidatus Rokubacteria bacterium]|nr:MaoC family dehydratase N-terminal domain-containing protein [Candidatus Rokubacteria bacterium]
MAYQPRGRHFEDFEVGEVIETCARTIDAADVTLFAGLSGDHNPLHTDEETAKTTPFGSRIAHGMLTVCISTGQQNQTGLFEGTTLALLGMDRLRFSGAVKFGDTIRTEMTVREVKESSKPDRGTVRLDVAVKNQRGETVATWDQAVLMRRRSA